MVCDTAPRPTVGGDTSLEDENTLNTTSYDSLASSEQSVNHQVENNISLQRRPSNRKIG